MKHLLSLLTLIFVSVAFNTFTFAQTHEQIKEFEPTATLHALAKMQKGFLKKNKMDEEKLKEVEKLHHQLYGRRENRDVLSEMLFKEKAALEFWDLFFQEMTKSYNPKEKINYEDCKVLIALNLAREGVKHSLEVNETFIEMRNYIKRVRNCNSLPNRRVEVAVLRLKYELVREELYEIKSLIISDNLSDEKIRAQIEKKEQELISLVERIDSLEGNE